MRDTRIYLGELGAIVIGSVVLIAGVIFFFPQLPVSEIDGIEVTGEGAIALTFLIVIGSMYRFRGSLDPEVYHPFVIGFIFLYFSALLDFLDEIVTVSKPVTYTVENLGAILGGISLVIAFGYWVNQYEQRGETLTEQEDKLQKRTEQLEILNQIVRHDIRNDLSVIQGMIELAREHTDAEGREYLGKADESVTEAIDLTETAREFIDSLADDRDQELDAISLHETLIAQIERVQQTQSDAEIRFDPDSEAAVAVLADKMLASLFRNLLVNAIKHNDKDVAHVEVSIEEQKNTVVVSVADNGPGIPEDVKTEVFGQGEKSLESTGTGVGLYLVDQLATQYGGEVWIEDNDPHGTIFNVRLPKANPG